MVFRATSLSILPLTPAANSPRNGTVATPFKKSLLSILMKLFFYNFQGLRYSYDKYLLAISELVKRSFTASHSRRSRVIIAIVPKCAIVVERCPISRVAQGCSRDLTQSRKLRIKLAALFL